jgi:hypothetical protein
MPFGGDLGKGRSRCPRTGGGDSIEEVGQEQQRDAFSGGEREEIRAHLHARLAGAGSQPTDPQA